MVAHADVIRLAPHRKPRPPWLPLYRWRFLALYTLLAAVVLAAAGGLYLETNSTPSARRAGASVTAPPAQALRQAAARVSQQLTVFDGMPLARIAAAVGHIGPRPLDRIFLARNTTTQDIATTTPRQTAVFEICGPGLLCTFPAASVTAVRAAALELALTSLARTRLEASLVLVPALAGPQGTIPPQAVYVDRTSAAAMQLLATSLANRQTLVGTLPPKLQRAVENAASANLYFVRPKPDGRDSMSVLLAPAALAATSRPDLPGPASPPVA